MTRYMVVGDIHQNATGPGARKDSWPDEINEKLAFISNLAAEKNCDAVLQLGDVWHNPRPSRTPHWLIQSTHDAMMSGGLPWYIVSGNHDQHHLGHDSMPEQPLGVLGRMRGIHLAYKSNKDFPEVFSIPYLDDLQELPKWVDQYNSYMDDHPEIKRGIIITHMSLFPLKDEPIYDFVADEDLAEMIKHPTTVMHGHLHFQQGARTYNDVEIINYGAISRGSLHKETLERQPQVYVYNSDTGKHRVFNVPVKDPAEVFALEAHELSQERSEKLTGFLEGLDTQEGSVVTSVEQMKEHVIGSESVSDDVKHIVSDLLDFAQE